MIHVYSESPGLGTELGIVIGNVFLYGMVFVRVSECLGVAADDVMGIGIAGSLIGFLPGTAVAAAYQRKRDNLL